MSVLVLKAPDGFISYLMPAGRMILCVFSDKTAIAARTYNSIRQNESIEDWVQRNIPDAVEDMLVSLEPFALVPRLPGRVSVPEGGPNLEWLVATSRMLTRSQARNHLLNMTFTAEPEAAWHRRCYDLSYKKWQQSLDELKGTTQSTEALEKLLSSEWVATIDSIPSDPLSRKYRDEWAWLDDKPEMNIDFDKVRKKRMNEVLKERDQRLKELDGQETKFHKDPEKLNLVLSQKQVLRDAPTVIGPLLDEANTLEEIESITLSNA